MLCTSVANASNRLTNIDGIGVAWATELVDTFLRGRGRLGLVFTTQYVSQFLARSGAGAYTSFVQTPTDLMESVAGQVGNAGIWLVLCLVRQVTVTKR